MHKYVDIETTSNTQTTDPHCSNNKIQGNFFFLIFQTDLFIHSEKMFPADVFD